MYNFTQGTKIMGTLQSGEAKVGEVVSEDEEFLWIIDQFGQGPFPWHKNSVEIKEVKE